VISHDIKELFKMIKKYKEQPNQLTRQQEQEIAKALSHLKLGITLNVIPLMDLDTKAKFIDLMISAYQLSDTTDPQAD
jgi:hypothetical protein